MKRMLIAVLAAACTLPAQSNAVTDWATIIQPAVNNASAPRPPASSEVLHTIVHLAVYDAVVAWRRDNRIDPTLGEVLVDPAGLVELPESGLEPVHNVAALRLVEALVVDAREPIDNAEMPGLR